MNTEQIRSAIAADAEILSLAKAGNTEAAARAIAEKTTEIVDTFGGIGVVLETLGPDAGAAALDALYAIRANRPAVKWAFYLIERGGLNFGSATVRGMIDQLVAAGVWPEQVGAQLKAIAEKPVTVTEFDVRKAIYADNGEVLV